MSFGAEVAAALPELRALATSNMPSRVTVRRKTGGTTTVDRMQVPEWAAVLTDVPFRLRDQGSRPVFVGGVSFEDAQGVGAFPYDTADLADDDLIEVTAGEWVGSVYRIVEAVKGDQRSARRVPIAEVARPEEWS